MLSAAEIMRLLDLKPHPEGGHFRETFRDPRMVDGSRAASTAAYYLLARGERSHWHRVDAVEVWHYHAGAPLKLEIALDANGLVECYQFIFTEKAAHDPVADHKLDVVEIDHSSARDLQQLLEIAHQANAASTPDPHPAMAPQDTAKVQAQHHQDAFHLA